MTKIASTCCNFVSESVFCVKMSKRGDWSLVEKLDVHKTYDGMSQMSQRHAACILNVSQCLLGVGC